MAVDLSRSYARQVRSGRLSADRLPKRKGAGVRIDRESADRVAEFVVDVKEAIVRAKNGVAGAAPGGHALLNAFPCPEN